MNARPLLNTLLLGTSLVVSACGMIGGKSARPAPIEAATTSIERSVNPSAINQHLEAVQKLLGLERAQQAEMLENARRDAEASRLASARLRHALLLATPGHPGYDPAAAMVILQDILSVPATLPPAERALALIEAQRMTSTAALAVENKKLRDQLERVERDQLASLNRRLAAESEENTKLRKALEEARSKLDAIGKIETGDRRPR